MARIAGVDLPREKRAEIGLTYIYGIGKATANEILAKAEIDPNVRIKDLSEEQVNELRKIIDNDFLVEGRDSFKYKEIKRYKMLQRYETC